MATLQYVWDPPCMQSPTVTVTLKEFSGKYSPDPILTNAQTKKGRWVFWLGARMQILFKAKATFDE